MTPTDVEQYKVADGIVEILLSGDKLSQPTTSLDTINTYGAQLYKANKEFIKEKVPDTWFAAIEPISGKLIAADEAIKLYSYSREHFPGKLIYVLGLLRDKQTNFLSTYVSI